jgi:hypothetical protein
LAGKNLGGVLMAGSGSFAHAIPEPEKEPIFCKQVGNKMERLATEKWLTS